MMMMTMMTLKSTLSFLLALSSLAQVRAEGFTYPTDTQNAFIEGDLVNVTWDVVAPRISLYEVCVDAIPLEQNISNPHSYIWNATRAHYHESGCVFELEMLGVNGLENPPNITSDLFGVSKRYPGDPEPTTYNFWSASSGESGSSSGWNGSSVPAVSSPTPTPSPSVRVAPVRFRG